MGSAQQHYDEGLRNFCKSKANKSAMWYGQAVRDFSEAIAADPDLMQAYSQRAACFAALGETQKADEDKARVRQLEASPSSVQQRDRSAAQAFCQRARQAMEGGGLIADALYFLQKAIDADPGYADAYDARSDVYFNLGFADEAMADIQRVGQLKSEGGVTSARVPSRPPESHPVVPSSSPRAASKPWWKFW